MNIYTAIRKAEEILPGRHAKEGKKDKRWQAIIKIGEFIPYNSEEVKDFIIKWGSNPQADLQAAIATCLLEHILEYEYSKYLPIFRSHASKNKNFASTFSMAWISTPKGTVHYNPKTKRIECKYKKDARGRKKGG